MNAVPALQKTIFQARYKPSLAFYARLMQAAQELPGYLDWETTGLTVVLKDFENHCSVIIGHNAFAYDQDNKDQNVEIERLQQVVSLLPKSLNIGAFSRLGYRRKYLIDVSLEFDQLVSILGPKLLSQQEALKRLTPGQIDDLMYRVDLIDDPLQYHLAVGPVRRVECPGLLGFNSAHHLKAEDREEHSRRINEKYPEVSVFVDVDVFQSSNELSADEAPRFVNSARELVDRLVNNLADYLFSSQLGG